MQPSPDSKYHGGAKVFGGVLAHTWAGAFAVGICTGQGMVSLSSPGGGQSWSLSSWVALANRGHPKPSPQEAVGWKRTRLSPALLQAQHQMLFWGLCLIWLKLDTGSIA